MNGSDEPCGGLYRTLLLVMLEFSVTAPGRAATGHERFPAINTRDDASCSDDSQLAAECAEPCGSPPQCPYEVPGSLTDVQPPTSVPRRSVQIFGLFYDLKCSVFHCKARCSA